MPLSDEDRENLVAYLDGELGEEAARSVEARISTDPELRAEADTLKQAWELLDYLPRPEPSPSFTHRTMERLALHQVRSTMTMPRPSPVRVWLTRAVWAAGLLLAFGAGFALARKDGPTLPLSRSADPAEVERALQHDLRLLENQPLYEHLGGLEFLRQLDAPSLFGDGSS